MSYRSDSPNNIPNKRVTPIVKVLKEIDRNIERLKLVLSIDNPFSPERSLEEKENLLERLSYKLNECKHLIDTNLSDGVEDFLSIYQKRVDIVRSITDDMVNDKKVESTTIVDLSSTPDIPYKTRHHQKTQDPLFDEESLLIQKERSKRIVEVSKNIIQLNEMCKDLQTMVIHQGENIDRIEKTVEVVNIKVQQSNELIQESESLQSTGFKAKFVAGFFIVVAAVSATMGVKFH